MVAVPSSAVSAMSALLYAAMGPAAWWLNAPGQQKVAATGGLVLLGAGAYGAMLLAIAVMLWWRGFLRHR